MQRVLAKAVVDTIKPSSPLFTGRYRVEVWGVEPHDFVRIYEIVAKDPGLAAREGIDRFVEEFEKEKV